MLLEEFSTETGIVVALGLVNEVAIAAVEATDSEVESIFAFDAASMADRPADHLPRLRALAFHLQTVIASADAGQVDDTARALNELLAASPAIARLEQVDGRWQLHHHPPGADIVQAWSAICAEALARFVGDGHAARMHLCAAGRCGRAFLDTTRSGTRRYCSERCQNREKAALRRHRQVTASASVALDRPDRRGVPHA